MTSIEVELAPGSADVFAATQKAIAILGEAGITARRRVRSLQVKGLIQVMDADTERALDLLLGANIRASIRPS
jgi:hypothetical protein